MPLFSCLFLSFHNKLKTNLRYLNHRANRRCDNLIDEDMFFELMRKEVMLSPKDASLKAEGEQWHAHGKQILNSMIDVSFTFNTIVIGSAKCQLFYLKNTNSGGIEQCVQGASSTESKSYTVTISPNRCIQRQCIPQCNESECGYLCHHTAQCTCADYIHGHLCKHTHKVNKSRLVRFINAY